MYQEKTAEELCAAGHAQHMLRVGQNGWVNQLMKRADERKAQDEKNLEEDCAKFRETGKWPARHKQILAKAGAGIPRLRHESTPKPKVQETKKKPKEAE